MKGKAALLSIVSGAVLFCFASTSPAQLDVGDYTVSGSIEAGGMPRHRSGGETKLEEYRDLPETLVVPQLELFLDSKKNDFYMEFGSLKTGLNDQSYRLRAGRYGLVDLEFVWDQIPHLFNVDNARTPFSMSGGNYTLSSKPAGSNGSDVRDWVNAAAQPVDLKLYNGLARFNLRYTPTPGWTFTGSYGSQNTAGKRAFGVYFGPSPGSYNITELAEPIDYQTHTIELGGEYAGNGWSVGLKYNGSLFHNNVSTLTWDNPLTAGVGAACVDSATYNQAARTGPCRGRLDLYPSNQAHTITLTGTASLPFKTHFAGTASYGWRLQDDPFLPFTINSAIAQPGISRRSLEGEVRPTMINATFVNNFFRDVGLKASYRYYDFDNRSKRVLLPGGIIVNDQGTATGEAFLTFPYSYAKQNLGFDASYNFTRWLTAKFGYGWERMHREFARELLNSNEHSFGPTLDIKPNSWSLFRLSYRRFIRDAHNYDTGHNAAVEIGESPDDIRLARLEELRKFDQAARVRNKFSFFTQVSPTERVTIYGGFDFNDDRYPRSVIGTQKDTDYAPSIGFLYAPLEWLSIFGDYNWERFDWRMDAIARNTGPGGCPDLTARTAENCPAATWRSRGNDEIHTVKFGTDIQAIRNVLNFRFQYGFSFGSSQVHASGNSAASGDTGVVPATNYPTIVNRWHEFLARGEYVFHKNLAVRLGYYFNSYSSKDVGVDIMKLWMGDVETPAGGPTFNSSIGRSIFLGDRGKGSYQAHIGFLGLRVKF
ncbi:MAG TPA: MtrB/PioB family decaheme-associated outer membrane protein [Methylomirabilota bacterium]|nr:MtrB/PioB family decaheme-associated outer membrane protein [Methylomirabilota bacterium]